MPEVVLYEVGPRDGLQNEKIPVPTEVKRDFVRALFESGLHEVESTSFVSPKAVPQLADAAELLGELTQPTWVLVPNEKGLDRALELGCTKIAIFTAASDAFTLKNIGKSVEESLEVFANVVSRFRAEVPGGKVRGYVSTVIECPYAGRIEPTRVAEVMERLMKMGCDQLSLGETIGVASPTDVRKLATEIRSTAPIDQVAWHFHDTRGTALANVFEAMEFGYRQFDASAGGLGGCPFAPGAGGNLATEDLVYALEREGIATGVSLSLLARASLPVLQALGRNPFAKAQVAELARL